MTNLSLKPAIGNWICREGVFVCRPDRVGTARFNLLAPFDTGGSRS